MLDPLNALGLASNIIQFVDFGVKLFSTSKQIYRSGSSTQNLDIDTITQDLEKLSGGLVPGGQSSSDPSIKGLQDLAEKCQTIARELIDTLQGLGPQQRNQKWESFKAALRTKWSGFKVKATFSRLEAYRDQIMMHMVKLLRFVHFTPPICMRHAEMSSSQ